MPLSATYNGLNKLQTQRGVRVPSAFVCRLVLTNPIASDPDGYSVSHAGAAAAGTTYMTLGGALAGVADYARNVVIVVTHASAVVAMSGTITGIGADGKNLSEAWSVTAGTTSKTFTGTKGFKRVTSITETIAATAAANTIVAGTGKVFGAAYPISVASGVKEIADGSVVTTGTLVAASTTSTADPRGTYSPAGTPDGIIDWTLYYLSDN
jgi:hypothetical protein